MAESQGSIDRDFLDTVESQITHFLRQTADLEADLAPIDNSNSFIGISENLATWQDRLGNLSRQTAVVEAELNEQEHALRNWFEALGLTSSKLAQAAK